MMILHTYQIISGDPINLFTEYFKVFGQKPCCFFDLRPYMSLLQGESLQKFLKELEEIVDLKEGEFPKTVCIYFIRFQFGT